MVKLYNLLKRNASQSLAFLAMFATIITVNSACIFLTYQEELPECSKKLRKF
jgi:cyclic lactone autoinducer peptide